MTVSLLPFNLATSAPDGWKTDYIIAMIVTGLVVLSLFTLYEVYLAPVPFLKREYLVNRTVIFTCLLPEGIWLCPDKNAGSRCWIDGSFLDLYLLH